MVKKILLMVVVLTLLGSAVAFSADVQKQYPNLNNTAPIKKSVLIRGDESLPNIPYNPTTPRLIAGSPGDTVGYTQYDYQTNGSSGNRVALDSQGGVHFAWMWMASYPLGARKAYYNYKNPGVPIVTGGNPIDANLTTHINEGYVQCASSPYMPDDTGDRAGVAYHNAVVGDSLYFAYDSYRGLSVFTINSFTMWFGAETCLWPYETIDRNNRVHVIASEASDIAGDVQTVGYRRSTNWGATWTAAAQVDTVITISPVITSSPVSDKVAIVYTHPFDTTDQWHNDVVYIQSTNGTTWDFRNSKVWVTNYGTDTDSITAYTDCDGVYDYNDNLHIIWPAQYLEETGGYLYYRTKLFHYDVNSATINEIAESFSSWDTGGCDFGGWNWSIAKSSIGVDNTNNALFVTYTSWNLGDCSNSGYANGDIYMHYSTNGGSTWTLKGNLTNSQTPDCLPGDCDSDHWGSLAEHANTDLHLFYTNDKDAGGVPQTEGSVTDNPLLYLAYTNPVRTSAVPAAPTLIFPYNDSTYASAYYEFQWDDPVGVSHYEFQVDDDMAFGSPVINNANVLNSEFVNIDGLLPATYYWRVRSVGFYGTSGWSTVFHFTVNYVGIIGQVYDTDGTTVLPGVNVWAIDIVPDTVGAEISGANGDYTFALLPGLYDVAFHKDGYADTVVEDIQVSTTLITLDMVMHTGGGGGNCDYTPGDINGNGTPNGIDVTYGVIYFKGGAPPPNNCGTPVGPCPQASPFFAAGDVNGNCVFNGIDITYYVNYLKGLVPSLSFCPTCPPAP